MDLLSIINDQFTELQVSQTNKKENLLSAYAHYAKLYRNLSADTIKQQITYIKRFFDWLICFSHDNPDNSIDPDIIQQFCFQYGSNHGPGSQRWMSLSLRSFLSFAYHHGFLIQDMKFAVPTARQRRLSKVPMGIDDQNIDILLQSIDTSQASGIRDYAIITLLATYGVRGIQIRKLRLQDIDWRQNTVTFKAVKGGNPVVQHLTNQVGNSLYEYISQVRPNDTHRTEIFLTIRKPYHPLRFISTPQTKFGHKHINDFFTNFSKRENRIKKELKNDSTFFR